MATAKTHKVIRTERVGAVVVRYAPCGASRRTARGVTTGAKMVEGDEAPTCARCADYFAPLAA